MKSRVFKAHLSAMDDEAGSTVQRINTSEKLHHVRYYAQLLTDFYYLKYMQDLWETQYQLLTMAHRQLASMAPDIGRFLTTALARVEQRHTRTIHRLSRTRHRLHQHRQQGARIVTRSPIDLPSLADLIVTFVHRGLHRLRDVHAYRKRLFQYDANEYRLQALLYELKPTEVQVGGVRGHASRFLQACPYFSSRL